MTNHVATTPLRFHPEVECIDRDEPQTALNIRGDDALHRRNDLCPQRPCDPLWACQEPRTARGSH